MSGYKDKKALTQLLLPPLLSGRKTRCPVDLRFQMLSIIFQGGLQTDELQRQASIRSPSSSSSTLSGELVLLLIID